MSNSNTELELESQTEEQGQGEDTEELEDNDKAVEETAPQIPAGKQSRAQLLLGTHTVCRHALS